MKHIIVKYINDSISPKELEVLKIWLVKPKNQKKFKQFLLLNNDLNATHITIDEVKAFKKVSAKIDKTTSTKSKGLVNVLKYAAILIGLSFLGYSVYDYTATSTITSVKVAPEITLQLEDGTIQVVKNDVETVILNASGKKVSEQKDNQLVYTNTENAEELLSYNTLIVPYGKTFGITLSDGSKVTLNAGSELTYPVRFIKGEKKRTVFLDGEAFFKVAKDKMHPFIVNTQDMDVEVLGTAFNVTSYSEDHKTYTVLMEGKVAAHNKLTGNNSVILSPNQRVYFNNNRLETETINTEKYVAWVKGKLVFIDDSFGVITNKLERKFNVTIHNNYAALNTIIITATFTTETIEQVLNTFQTYKAFNYTLKNGVVTITKPN
ncbi:DUF4974 domain-containing protein [Bizionia gelidisalsuginis]|uniref:DUF4974 domain-containing protein n=1 Tax=Bizionia gelidisalsuginis TaxID=291188 RepID=A0ABY3M9U8_9FLAO|nr:FecR family protein [Bizionia gelidisalsuginis]TYC12068.1 DUF4974 domain-containing protein [Bizionia gelidisalsuginis]